MSQVATQQSVTQPTGTHLPRVVPDARVPKTIDQAQEYALKPNNCAAANARHAFITALLADQSDKPLAQYVISTLAQIKQDGHHPLAALARGCAVGARACPAKTAVMKWIHDYSVRGLEGLVAKRMGRRPKTKAYNWRGVALAHYNQPSKPTVSSVHKLLVEVYGYEVSYGSVRNFLQSMPSNLAAYSKQRLGPKSHRLWESYHHSRTTDGLAVGDMYMADGHTLDVRLLHPISNKPFRAELVVWMDVRSRFVVGWTLASAESTNSTLHAIAGAIDTHQHVPALVYLDNGCGYKSKSMTDEATGFFYRMGIDPMFAIPGHPHSKGQIERFFRTMEEDFNKTLFPTAFVGRGMSDEVATKTFNKNKSSYPTTYEWAEAFGAWLRRHHNRPHPEVKDTTPAAMWAGLERAEPHTSVEQLARPQVVRVVQKGQLQLDNRKYRHELLVGFNHREVVVEYDLVDDSRIWVRFTTDLGLICVATLVHKMPMVPTSRLEEARANRFKQQQARLKRKLDDKKMEAGLPETGQAQADGAMALIGDTIDDGSEQIEIDLNDI